MERSRVEDIKKKFECLQVQSTTTKNYFNKSPTDNRTKDPVGKFKYEPQNVKLGSSSSFVGRGNIKRSHAFRADKPISRNFNNGDLQPSLFEPTNSNDVCTQPIPQNNHTSIANYELKIKDKSEVHYNNEIKANIHVKNISRNLPAKASNVSSSQINNMESKTVKDSVEVRSVDNNDVQKSPGDLYSAVFKQKKSPQQLSCSVSNNLDFSERNTCANVSNISKHFSKDNSPVNCISKTVERQTSPKISLNEKLKPQNVSQSTSNIPAECLTNTLKAALSAPLPSGPPPKKPPRTFAHNVACSLEYEKNECDESQKQALLKTSSTSSVRQTNTDCMMNRPIRSKTESQIMLKKLENYLLNHKQNVVDGSPRTHHKRTLKRIKSKNASEVDLDNHNKNNSKINRQFSVDNEELVKNINLRTNSSIKSNFNNNSNRQPSNSITNSICFQSLNCTRQPVYDTPVLKTANFFVTMPRHLSVDDSKHEFRKSYGLIQRSASEEHIYAEPQTLLDEINSKLSNSTKITNKFQVHQGDRNTTRSHQSSLSPVNNINKSEGVQQLKMHFERSPNSKDSTKEETKALQYGLHYMCTPINDTTSFNESLDSSADISDGFNDRNVKRIINNTNGDRSKAINEAVNTNVRLNISPPRLMSKTHEQFSLVSDCSRPRQIRMATSGQQSVPEIDKHRIHQLLSEAYGRIRHNTNSDKMLSGGQVAGSSGEMASGSDSDCSSVVSSADDPLQPNYQLQSASTNDMLAIAGNPHTGFPMKHPKDREQIIAERKGYVRRVSRRLTSIRRSPHLTPDSTSHLFECLLIVGLDLKDRCKVPYIKTKFPENVSPPGRIGDLCFPDADDWPPSPDSGQSYMQVLTDSNGVRKYSYSRRVQPEDAAICLPLVYCIITPFKANSFYNKILIDLESKHGHQSDSELLKFIQQLYDCPFPAPGQRLSFQQHMNFESTMDVYVRPLDSRQEDNELIQLLLTLKLSMFLQIFATLLHERKVILVSDSISKLSVCVEGLQSALYPFHWEHTIVPILPSVLMDVCAAPTPYLIGIIKPKLTDIPFNDVDLDLVIDIDDGLILNCKGDEGWILPSRLSRGLRSALQLSVQASQSDVSTANLLANEAIMRLFVELVGHYRNHITVVSSDTKKRKFEKESFIRSCSSRSIQLFLEWFTETAMFHTFIESRLERTNESRGLFEQRCSEYSEENENGRSIIKNYKALNKTVKTLGDRFKDWATLS